MQPPKIDIERVPVEDDPRAWSEMRKVSRCCSLRLAADGLWSPPLCEPQNVTLVIISAAAMIAGLGANIQNRRSHLSSTQLMHVNTQASHLISAAIQQMERQLPATSSQISLSLSLFILLQGVVPLIWSAVSEIKGRKASLQMEETQYVKLTINMLQLVYISSVGLTALGCIGTALSPNIDLVVFFRCIQGAGSGFRLSLTLSHKADFLAGRPQSSPSEQQHSPISIHQPSEVQRWGYTMLHHYLGHRLVLFSVARSRRDSHGAPASGSWPSSRDRVSFRSSCFSKIPGARSGV